MAALLVALLVPLWVESSVVWKVVLLVGPWVSEVVGQMELSRVDKRVQVLVDELDQQLAF